MEIDMAVKNFEQLISSYNIKPIACEIVVVNKEENYAGKIDLIAEVNNAMALIDYKTSRAVRETHEAQLVAYKKALLSNYYPNDPYKVRNSKCMIAKLNFQKSLLVWNVSDEERAWNLFKLANSNYQKKNGVKVFVE
jgi:hypothetical protein